jgi:hypothetical protein
MTGLSIRFFKIQVENTGSMFQALEPDCAMLAIGENMAQKRLCRKSDDSGA